MAIAFALLIPLIQISLHQWGKSGLFADQSTAQQTGLDVLYNLPDTLSYASWATQAKLGYITFSDLFTTEPHPAALFNLYFLTLGFLSRLVGIDALSLMEYSSLLLGPLSPGADAHYLDLFPLSSLLFYPYHAATFVLLSFVVLLATRILSTEDGPGWLRRVVLLGVLFLVTGLVRPYDAATLALVFNLALLFGLIGRHGARLGTAVATCIVVNLFAFPPIAYAAFMATQPVWGSFADNSMAFETAGAGFFFKGFAILWVLASIGLFFAVADRRHDLSVVSCWAIVAMALLLFSPSYGSKFAGGSVLPTGVLAAYGVHRLLQRNRAFRPLVIGAVGVMCLTPIVAFADIVQVGAPRIDVELLTAGKLIREFEGARLPVVLTESDAGSVLAALFGHRVYAGHWSLTPGYLGKVEELRRAGLAPSGAPASGYDRHLLAKLVRDSRADYVLLRRSAPAMEAVATCSHSKPVFEGDRWIAVGTASWSCP